MGRLTRHRPSVCGQPGEPVVLRQIGPVRAVPGRQITSWPEIRTARLKAGLSQQDLADRMGVTQVAVSSWERDRARPARRPLAETGLHRSGRFVASRGAAPSRPSAKGTWVFDCAAKACPDGGSRPRFGGNAYSARHSFAPITKSAPATAFPAPPAGTETASASGRLRSAAWIAQSRPRASPPPRSRSRDRGRGR